MKSLLSLYPEEEVKELLGGYADMLSRADKHYLEHVLFVCENCHRVYMWVPLKDYQVFQCVSSRHSRYDRDPSPPIEITSFVD